MGWRESKTGTREMGQFASYRSSFRLAPTAVSVRACRLHASSLSFCSELVRRALIHAHENSEAEGREEPARASVFRSRLSEGVREGSGNGYIARHIQQPHGFSFDAWHLTSPTGRIKQYHGDIKTLFYTNFVVRGRIIFSFSSSQSWRSSMKPHFYYAFIFCAVYYWLEPTEGNRFARQASSKWNFITVSMNVTATHWDRNFDGPDHDYVTGRNRRCSRLRSLSSSNLNTMQN